MNAPADVERRVRELLADVYTPEGVEVWLDARNLNLNDNVPRSVLACCSDCAATVLAEAERVAGAM